MATPDSLYLSPTYTYDKKETTPRFFVVVARYLSNDSCYKCSYF